MKHTVQVFLMSFFLAAGIAGCAGIDPSQLQRTNSADYVVVEKPVKFSESFIAGIQHYTIRAGKYKSRYTDGAGTYYQGEGKCFTISYEYKNPVPEENLRCGVYIPYTDEAEPKLYFYRDPEKSAQVFRNANASGTLIHAFEKAELDNLHFFRYQPAPGTLARVIKR